MTLLLVCSGAGAVGGGLIVAALGKRQQQGRTRRRDLVIETIDGERAAGSRYADALREAGFRSMGTGLRYYVGVR